MIAGLVVPFWAEDGSQAGLGEVMTTAPTEDLKTLAAPGRAAIIVMDPQHDFCSEKEALGSLSAGATVNEQFAVGR